MADNVVDVEIVNLPEATGVTGDTLFPGYVPGALKPAQKITAEQLKEYFGQEVFVATYGVTAPADVEAAYTEGKVLFCDFFGTIASVTAQTDSHFVFTFITGASSARLALNRATGYWEMSSVVLQDTTQRTTNISKDSTDTQYPSAKAVYDLAQSLVIGGEDGGYYIPNVSQPDQYTMQVDFTASKDDMAQAPTSYINLPPGPKGTPGEPGQPGSPGSPGMDGDDGKSAYEYAQDGGYIGTEEEFAKKLAAGQPDWNQNDRTAADYIKNKPFGDGEDTTFVVPETEVVIDLDIGTGEFQSQYAIIEEKNYTVEWDGETYVCQSTIGNGWDGSEDFTTVDLVVSDYLSIYYYGDGRYVVFFGGDPGTHTLSIYTGSGVKKLDGKYLPTETWTFTLEDGSTVKKKVVVAE